MFDTFPRYPRYHQYERKKSVFNEAYVEQNGLRNSEDFAQEFVRVHNHYRAQHGCPPLHLSYSICAVSQEWANRISAEDHFHHSNHPQYGENLFVIYMSNNSLPMLTAQQVVESWYSEHVFYPFHGHITRDIISKAGHFTQVIWSNSRELGIGKAFSKNNRLYIVANYYPAGNILRKFAENVPPKIHNYSHIPHYYSRRVSSRIDVDTLTQNRHGPQYHRASSKQFGVDSEISTGTLHVPHLYARKISNQHLDVDNSTETLHVPHQYARKISNSHLDVDNSTGTLDIPHQYARKVSHRHLDVDNSTGTLHVPHQYTRKISNQHLEVDNSTGTLHMPHQCARKISNMQLDTAVEALHVPQIYNRRNLSKQFAASDSSAETLHVPQYYTTRNSRKRLDDNDSAESEQIPYHNNHRYSGRRRNFDNAAETYVPQYYVRTSSRRRFN